MRRWIVGLGTLLMAATVLALLPGPLAAHASAPSSTPRAALVGSDWALPALDSGLHRVTGAPAADEDDAGKWVAVHTPTELWSSSAGGTSFGPIKQWSYLQLTGKAEDGRLYVFNPATQNYAWINATTVGPVPPPPAGYFDGPQVLSRIQLPGRAVESYNVRNWPTVDDATYLRTLSHNTPLHVYEAVAGHDGDTWYRIGEGEYVHSAGVRLPRPPPQVFSGRWIDVDLNTPAMIVAYEDDRPVYAALAIKGTRVDGTPTGLHHIVRRVANETMDSATIGIPRASERGYYLEDVLYTQYFTWSGAAIHYNYWSDVFGYAGSHGCLGLNLEDSESFWSWATVGTPVHIHY